MAKSIENNIFPDLPPRAELFEKVSLIEKGWLDQSDLGFPDYLTSLVRGFTFFRIRGVLAAFEENDARLKAIGFNSNLFAAIYNLGYPLIYVIQCQDGQVTPFLATNSAGAPSLTALLETILGRSLYETYDRMALQEMEQYSHCTAITGIPTLPVTKGEIKSFLRDASIDNLILGLMKGKWTYIVQAFPIRRQQTSVWLETCAREVKDIKESFLLRDIQKSNRMASYYVEVLEKSIKRLKTGKQQGLWQAGIYLLSDRADTVSRGAALLSSIFSGDRSNPEPVRCHICSRSSDIPPFINCYHSKELKAFISLPSREFPGFRLHEQALFDVDFVRDKEKPIYVGQIMANDQILDHTVSAPIDDLTRHALVTGVTGSGKTNSVFNLLKELHVTWGVPFLIIEPAKSEYRNLLPQMNSLLIFTLGQERPGLSSPFRLNPFSFPDGISLQTHIDYLKAVFDASFVMYAPMPYVLEECLYKIYEDKGWNLVSSSCSRGKGEAAFPTLSDLYLKIDEVVESLGYQDRTTMDIRAALKIRIKNLCIGGKGMMLNTTLSIPFDEIMARPTVLELKYLGNDEEKAFMMGLILTAVWEYYESITGRQDKANKGINHLTVIEEAHRLLKNVPAEKASEDMSNIKGKAVETFCNLLAEMRAYGEGVLVSEQIPVKLAPDIIKNSSLKIMHRMVAKEDREIVGDTMNLDKHQKRLVTSLETGEAVFFREGLDRSLKIRIPLSDFNKQESVLGDHTIHKIMAARFFDHHSSLLTVFPACNDCLHKDDQACETTRREIEEISSAYSWREIYVKVLLPYLLEPERNGLREHLEAVVHIDESSFHCLAAHLVRDYLKARGDYFKWSFESIDSLTAEAQLVIKTGGFAKMIGQRCRDLAVKGKGQYGLCERFCRQRCLFGYEGSVLAKDPVVHNRLVDLLNSSEYGPRFCQELVILIFDFLREYLPPEQERYLNDLAVCYLIQKLNELRFSLSLQHRILEEFINIIRVTNNT